MLSAGRGTATRPGSGWPTRMSSALTGLAIARIVGRRGAERDQAVHAQRDERPVTVSRSILRSTTPPLK